VNGDVNCELPRNDLRSLTLPSVASHIRMERMDQVADRILSEMLLRWSRWSI